MNTFQMSNPEAFTEEWEDEQSILAAEAEVATLEQDETYNKYVEDCGGMG